MSDKHFVVECPACGDGDGHLWDCPLHDDDTELHPAGTRTDLDALHERIAFLEAATEAGEANYQTIKALLTNVGDAKLALETENTRMATVEEQRDNWKESARFHLKNEEYYRKERDDLFATVAKHETVIASLVSLLASGAGEDSPEYLWALELIGAPSDGDVSAPEGCSECGSPGRELANGICQECEMDAYNADGQKASDTPPEIE